MRPKITLHGPCAALFLALTPLAQAQFQAEAPPTWRGAPGTHLGAWDVFTSPFMGPNQPDLAISTAPGASLVQTQPGGILTSTGNLYHPSGPGSFVITDTAPADVLEVVLMVNTQGNPLDTQTPSLTFASQGTTTTLPFDTYELLASQAGNDEHKFTWQLCAQASDIRSYEVQFQATTSHMALAEVRLDTRFDSHCGTGPGTNYCAANPNSTGASATVRTQGSDLVSANDLTLVASGLPAGEFGYFLAGTAQGFLQNPGGSAGNLCLGGSLARFNRPGEFGMAGGSGEISLTLDLTRIPSPSNPTVLAGESWSFQGWFRDGGTSNFTDGITVDFR